ncbi:TonB-dependent receptor [Flavobacterium psychrophilum]|uniref:TonB-dependent receptor n=1 Tax=Flavobacterium psychrophilum TaxID=96345 RepID=UPI0004F7C2FA|nr:TonB-dependent receptor [Flavobacterium psychrophilum]AIN73266.1 TonB-dependent receptor [Flavobacterium psychrophilum FPG3]EKT2069614.1 TonB-dependent receptor [Flavobacterium psychrophilum]EKT2071874.1 TonB-dependent receptor [Flavobacterium psychrophilum]EKT4491396.1 TonB-dependent receptor [Flavobacterium psychrophilum]MBF2043848.1 TonB-dependent receptor [Flavobacterium psychrophilum]
MKFSITFLLLLITTSIFAQNATVSGFVLDKDLKNEPLPFANVNIKGTLIATTTDATGKYTIDVPTGNHEIVFSFLGYESKSVLFSITNNEKKTISQSIGSGSVTMEDVVIKSTISREKETALLLDQKKAVEIKQSIGSQEMSRKGVSDVEAGLTKITGISKVDSRGLFVRGLEDRYNNLLINDLAAPTNNPFTKIIPLDLFPTDIVSIIDVYKTFNPNIYGDFAGGTFNIQTSKGAKSITKLNIGTSFTTNNNLNNFLISEEANNTKGFFGFNGKDRELPSIVGSTPLSHTFTTEESRKYFKSGFNATETKSPLNTSIGFLHSEKFNLKNERNFSYLISLNFDNKYAVKSGIERTINNDLTGYKFSNDFMATEYLYKTSATTLLGLNYNTQRIKLSLNTFYIKTTENSIKDQFGVVDRKTDDPNHIIRTNQLTKTDYLNAQLLGEYALAKDKSQIFRTGFSFANTKYSQPDRKSFSGSLNNNNITTFYGATNFSHQYLSIDGNKFLSGLAEYSYKFGNKEKQNKIILGYNGNTSAMESSYRFIATQSNLTGFTTNINSIDTHINNDLIDRDVIANGPDAPYLFNIENSNATYKVKLNEFTNAGYLNLLLKFNNKWEINGGLRVEKSNRETKFRKLGMQTAPFETRKYDKIYFLPSLNLKYGVSDKANIRFATSKTYTKPVIMEAFPLTYLNADGTSIQGNSLLKNSDNYNADLKFEIFPTSKEMFSLGIFTKYIKNPIERTYVSNATTATVTTFLNSDLANIYGAEAEFILDLERINKNLSDFSLGFNATLMSTKVKVSPTYDSQDEDGNITYNIPSRETYQSRELQGASKWILNSDLKYQFDFDKKWSNTISLVYSVFSKRIYAIGTNKQDNTYELPYQQLDFVWGSKLSDHFDVKFSATNLLNPSRNREFGSAGVIKINEPSLISDSYKKGIGFGLNLGYTF